MKITSDNYQSYFLDFSEKNLSLEMTDELFAFLNENPQYQEEFDCLAGLDSVILESEDVEFQLKDKLFAIPNLNLIDLTDVEYLSIAELEGDINPEEKQRLQSLIAEKPESAVIAEQIKHTRIKPETDIIYPKQRIKRNLTVMRIKRAAYPMAAAVMLLFGISYLAPKTVYTQAKPIYAAYVSADGGAKIEIPNETRSDEHTYINVLSHNQTNSSINTVASEKDNAPEFAEWTPNTTSDLPELKQIAFFASAQTQLTTVPEIQIFDTPEQKSTWSDKVRDVNTPETLWAIAEGSVKVFRKATDSDIQMNNSYTQEGNIKELNLYTSNFKIRRTFSH